MDMSYCVNGGTAHFAQFKEFKDAYELFSSFFNNVGILQLEAMKEHPDLDFEDNIEEYKNLIAEKQSHKT